MELVEGATLAERIKKGPLSFAEAVSIARQIADALAAAHDKGIVHRDLKPANVKITPDGTVKLLDFGLATMTAAALVNADDSATIAVSTSGVGVIAGTPGYMAPEQARGAQIDKRVDIWAFGVVFYEMLVGANPFAGETTTEVLAAVMRDEPDLSRVPVAARSVLRRCLEKDPKRRLRDVSDAMLLLDDASDAAPTEPAAVPPPGRSWLPWGIAAGLFVMLAGVVAMQLRTAPVSTTPVRFKFRLPEGVAFTQTAPFALSPDGRRLAFPAVSADGVPRVWVQDFADAEPRPLTEVQPNPLTLAWSPDGRQILYSHQNKLKRVDIGGSPPETIVDRLGAPALVGAVWLEDNTIVFGTATGVMKVPAAGGTPVPLTKTDPGKGELDLVLSALTGGNFLYERSGPPGARAVYIGSRDAAPEAQSAAPLLKTDMGALFAPKSAGADDGQLFFMRDTTLVAQPFNARTRELRGEPQTVATGVYFVGSPAMGLPYVAVSREGSVAYRTGTVADLARQLVWYSRDGERLGSVAERARFQTLRLSADASRLVVSQTELRTGNNADIWIIDVAGGGSNTRFTFGPEADVQPTWSPDGRFIAWAAVRNGQPGIYRKPANGAGDEELLYQFPKGSNGSIIVADWSAQGFLVYAFNADIFALPIGPGTTASRQPIAILQTSAREFGPDLSPDGRWLAYISDETGRQELFVRPFEPGASVAGGTAVTSGKWMVSNNGTLGLARWRGDGKELLFTDGDGNLMAVDVAADPLFHAGPPRRLFQLSRQFLAQAQNPGTLADITADGRRVLLAMPSEESTRPELSVVLGWQPARPSVHD
jgi:Tol biopolymer transport system component